MRLKTDDRREKERKLERILRKGIKKGLLNARVGEKGNPHFELTKLGKLTLENKGYKYVVVDPKIGKVMDRW